MPRGRRACTVEWGLQQPEVWGGLGPTTPSVRAPRLPCSILGLGVSL